MMKTNMMQVMVLAVMGLWQLSARAEALEGRITSLGVEEVGEQAYLVLTVDSPQELSTPQCPRADRVMVAPLSSALGRHLAKLAGGVMTRGEVVIVTLGGCDPQCYDRRRIRSLVLRRQGMPGPGMIFG